MSPFASNPHDAVAASGESALIAQIREWLGAANPPEPAGIGDDCAVFESPGLDRQLLITTDPVIYGKHFDDTLSPEQTAAKLVKRNLSDIAAMGGLPTLATVSLALDPRVSAIWMERFYRELARCAQRYAFQVVGGDVSSAEGFIGAFLTLIGRTQQNTRALPRHGATERCPIYVTGELGGTRLRKHFDFEPRLAEGQWLARQFACVSCSDLSDGLGKDFANILADGCSAEIDAHRIPIAPAAREAASLTGQTPLRHAFDDGEDFELLFALKPHADCNAFEAAWDSAFSLKITRIGTAKAIGPSPRLALRNAPDGFSPHGYEHLR